jgi:hypothetical protein
MKPANVVLFVVVIVVVVVIEPSQLHKGRRAHVPNG